MSRYVIHGLEVLVAFALFLIVVVMVSGFVMVLCTTSNVCMYMANAIKLLYDVLFIFLIGLIAYAVIVMVVVLRDR